MNSKRIDSGTGRPFLTVIVCAALSLLASRVDASERRRTIQVGTVERLYAAVNNDANRGATIHLAPGSYVLSTIDTHGGRNVPRPNHGALRLQPGMSLVGSEERVDTDDDGVPDPISPDTPDDFAVPGTETVIDGSALDLPAEERADCAGDSRVAFPDPVIYIGIGNAISALSVVGGSHIAIGEPTSDPADRRGNLSIEITSTVVESALFAVSFSNSECTARRAHSVLTLSHSVVRGAGFIGLGISNFYTGDADNDGSAGPEIQATVTFNLFYNNGRAVRAAAADEGTDGGSVNVHMAGNVFRNNGTNLLGQGGVGRDMLTVVGNRLSVTSEHDTFGEAPGGSVILFGGIGDAQDSGLDATFLHSRFIRDSPDTPPEFSIFGAQNDDGGGSDIHAEVLISRATVKTSAGVATQGGLSIQDETGVGAGPISARLEGSRRGFIQMNQGLPAPDAYFFEK